MRMTIIAAAALLTFGSGAAFAQNMTGSAQTPPSPNAGSQTVEPTNSLPRGAESALTERPGSDLGSSTTPPARAYPVPTAPRR